MENNEEILSTINGFNSKFKCEKCGNEQNVNIFPYINFNENPEYYAHVKDLNLFNIVCNTCKSKSLIQYDALYVSETFNYFIYFLTNKNDLKKFYQQINFFIETTINKDEKYDLEKIKTRVVTSLNDLIEKMTIFEYQLNDIAIEILKYGIKDKVLEKSEINRSDVYFDGINSTNLEFIVYRRDNDDMKKIPLNIEVYNNIIEKINNLKINNNFFPIIDQQWINEKLNYK